MSVLAALVQKEVRLALRARRVRLGGAAMLILSALAAVSGGREFASRNTLAADIAEHGEAAFQSQRAAHPHSIAHNGYIVARPPAPLGFVDGGVDLAYGTYVRLDAHRTRALQGARLSELARGPGAGRFDLGVLLAFFAPALLFILGYDQIAGERARGTFSILNTLGVHPGALVASKVLGLSLRAALAIGVPVLIGVGLATAIAGTFPALRLLTWLATHGLAMLVWIAIVLAVSAAASSRENALLLGLALWGTLTLVVPPFAGGIARVFRPVPPPGEEIVKAETWAQSAHEANEELRDRALREIKKRHPGWDGTGEPPEVLDAVMLRLADAEIAAKVAALNDRLEQEGDAQQRLATIASLLSPAGLASVASSAIAGSDLAHMRATWRHFEDYRVQLMAWFNDWWARRGAGGFEAYDTEKQFDEFASAPRLSAPRLGLAYSLARAALPLGLLLFIGVLAHWLLHRFVSSRIVSRVT